MNMDIADEYFNLLDYNEEDLDTDLAAIQNQEVAQTTEFEVATQVGAEDMENHDDQDDSIEKIEFYFTRGGVMKCPIEGCTAGRFTFKCKYARHWTEKHVQISIKCHCSVRNCTVTCRRRYDMKTHLKEVHRERDRLRVEDLTRKCEKTVMENRGYTDPGFVTFNPLPFTPVQLTGETNFKIFLGHLDLFNRHLLTYRCG